MKVAVDAVGQLSEDIYCQKCSRLIRKAITNKTASCHILSIRCPYCEPDMWAARVAARVKARGLLRR